MALADKGQAPYAPGPAVLDVIEFARGRGLPVPLNTEKLEKMGITDSYSRRTLRTLEILDLVDEDGNPTDTFEKIRLVPSDQLPTTLAEWFREAYKPVLTYVEPSSDIEKIIDQFRAYEPAGMRDRMVSLFLALAVAAGLIPDRPRKPRSPGKARRPPAPAAANKKTADESPPADKAEPPAANANGAPAQHASDAKERYLQFLIGLAEKQDAPDPGLLDRIERVLLGVPTKGASP